ncbi:indole-3-glycerol phosphate synthase TrpC [Metabacillus sediminilitoris]|jgi:indole-3-glycerol phosphate synthase|uniref:Indole-3-glycerol phosphate synthase n=1 Tax=Metabacillus sediminilitoris TaxID=2567941 RepID=A0A4S4C4X0_9BACI|nr:indole-3-glycerol phosphate synthase TrpC [Metabacillus sediminilitoris]QGQ46687.1 indole-3-glycerol phosphate synthase TrpC [Metabacillus sediminilitoris]THF82837.1 indole-3-glycerol phosphate synthase TrpC [Metabacillus sediminilitoris]
MLNKIIETKKEEIKNLVLPADEKLPHRSFYQALKYPKREIGLIAEVKKASPSKGLIKENFQPVEIALAYEKGGADCLSVLTDNPFFQGKREYLTSVKKSVNLPILRKDFIIDHIQVDEAKRIGADAILLIGEALDPSLLKELNQYATELTLDVLVEVHDLQTLEQVLKVITPKILGVNNRNLKTFEVDIQQLENMVSYIPKDTLLVSESGLYTKDDLKQVQQYGAKAVLVGESLMRKEDQTLAIQQFFGESVNV